MHIQNVSVDKFYVFRDIAPALAGLNLEVKVFDGGHETAAPKLSLLPVNKGFSEDDGSEEDEIHFV